MTTGQDKPEFKSRIVDDKGHCLLCEGTHYGTGIYTCPFQCDRCRVNTEPCAQEGCQRNARWAEEIRASARSPKSPSSLARDDWKYCPGCADPWEPAEAACGLRDCPHATAPAATEHPDALWEHWYGRCRDALLELSATKLLLAEEKPTEYICKCGVRVTPHRCSEGTDF